MTQAKTLAEAFADICEMDAPLNARLAAYSSKLRELNFPFAEAYDELVARLYSGEVGRAAPAVGEPLLPFALPSKTGNLVTLQDLTAEGPVVVSLNRGHWCPFCRIELKTIADYHREIADEGAKVVSIMPDRQQFVGNIEVLTNGSVSILTDIDHGYSLSLGLAMWVGDKLKAIMKGRGYQLDTYHGNDGWFLPVPATFVVARDGIIQARFVDADFRKRMEIDEIRSALKNQKRAR